MRVVEVPSSEVRLSASAAEALATDRAVVVTRYGRRSHVVLNADQFALVEPLLELLQSGGPVPAELLMTEDDLALERALAEDRQPSLGEVALVAELLAELPER
jgi:PHD/YefM family antitoxin component YafN of YafNO toxin-antitoxin module